MSTRTTQDIMEEAAYAIIERHPYSVDEVVEIFDEVLCYEEVVEALIGMVEDAKARGMDAKKSPAYREALRLVNGYINDFKSIAEEREDTDGSREEETVGG